MRDWHERRVLSLVTNPRESTKVGDTSCATGRFLQREADFKEDTAVTPDESSLRSYIQWSSKHSTLYLTVLLGACRAIDMPYRYMCTDSGGPLISPDTGFPLKRHT